tara:strand:+ start:208 stop:426 length:219 start_codon:yes stop_codon:yes gene_type:complete
VWDYSSNWRVDMFNTNELRSLEEAIENYGSRCSGIEWRELLAKVRRERFDSQINPFVDDSGNRIDDKEEAAG